MISAAYRQHRFACVGLVLLLAACGGGGGGGGGSNPPPPPPLGLTVNPTAVAFAAPQNGPLPPSQNVQVTLTRADVFTVTVRFAPSVSAPSWLPSAPLLTGSGANWTLSGSVATTALAPGTYTTTVRVEAKDANQSVLAFSDVEVSYIIQPLGSLAANPSGITFSQVIGAPPPASQSVGISDPAGGSYSWSASIIYQSGSGWLNVNAGNSASGASLPASLSVSVNPPLSAGTLSATIRVTWFGPTLDIPVTLTVSDPQVTPAQLSLSFSALRLGPAPATQDIALNTQGGFPVAYTGSVTYGAGATGWLNAPASGTAPGTMTVGVNTTTLTPGTYSASLRISTASQAFVVAVTYVVSEPQVTLSATSLSFSALRLGPNPPTKDITLSNSSGVAVPFTTAVTFTGPSPWLTVPASGTAPGTLTLGINNTTLAPGTYSATVTLRTAARNISVSVTYVLSEPTLTRSPTQLTFNAPSTGALPATQDVTLTTQQNLSLGYATSIVYGGGASGWLNAPASGTAPGTLTFGINTTDLAPGTYTANVAVFTAAQSLQVLVTYVVATSALTFSPASPSFVIDTTSGASALSQSVVVGTTGVPLSWTATSSKPWLIVTPASATSVTLTLVPAQLEPLDAGQQSATVTFSYTPPHQAPTTAPLSVSLDLRLPKVTSVHPYVATSGTSLEVILRGSGFSSPGGNLANFGATPGSAQTVVSDTELHVTHPSLSAGSYPVAVTNQLGLPRSTANLVVVDAPAYAATTIDYPAVPAAALPRVPMKMFYDAERKALLVVVAYQGAGTVPEIQRYAFTGSAWSATPITVPVPILANFPFEFDVNPTLDGKKLLVASNVAIQEFDMATLAPGISTNAPLFSGDFLSRFAIANDGIAIVTTPSFSNFKYSVADRTFTPLFSPIFNCAFPGGSADGSLLVLPPTCSSSEPVLLYDASISTLFESNLRRAADSPRLDRRATRIMLSFSQIYDRNLQLLGTVPFAHILSPDGKRAYAADATVLHTYDLTGTPPAGLFQEIGIGTPLPGTVTGPSGIAVTISSDGSTVFIAGSDRIIVVPVP